jgi:hypothetical protein
VDAQTEVAIKALRRMLAALNGMGHQPALVGPIACSAWGCTSPRATVQLLTPTGESQRASILGAARGEGFQQSPDGPLRLTLADAKLNATARLELIEAGTPFLKQVLGRAQRRPVLGVDPAVASCEDLIVMGAASADPADTEDLINLLRVNAGRIDAAYVKREAETAGTFDALKRAWAEAKRRG